MKKVALITGINGQDGSYLAELLLEKGYEVWGILKRNSVAENQTAKIPDKIYKKLNLVYGDMTDIPSLISVIQKCKPDEVYNLAAQSSVSESWVMPEQTSDINGLGVLRMLEAIRESNIETKFYQASTSEMFGKVTETPQNENTPFYPRSPYGVAKLYGHWITKNYRESYNMFACSGILFNHESERRGIEFVTRKISDGVARIKLGLTDHITLGNLDAKRDWGYAPDYVEAMWMMLQQDKPEDYVIATGKTHSIRDFLRVAFTHIGIINWKKYVKQDPRFMRPAEVDVVIGDYTKAKYKLGWKPKVGFENLVKIMVNNDLKKLGDK